MGAGARTSLALALAKEYERNMCGMYCVEKDTSVPRTSQSL